MMAQPTIATRALWDDAKHAFLIEEMTAQARAGKPADSGLKKEAWWEATTAINKEFDERFTIGQVKTRVQTLKSHYNMAKEMLKASGSQP